MTDLIDRQQAIDAIKTWGLVDGLSEGQAIEILSDESKVPSAQPGHPTGEWIQKPRYEDDENPDTQPNLKCPFCGFEICWWDMDNYCAKCGADLKGEQK